MESQTAPNEATDVENREPSHVGLSALLGDDAEVVGEIIDVSHSSYWGMEVGTVRCPLCDTEVEIKAMSDSQCLCGLEWSFECRAIGQK